MIEKIARILTILFVIIALGIASQYIVPLKRDYRGTDYHKIVYSELLNDFLTFRYQERQQEEQSFSSLVITDSKGNIYTSQQADSLCPLNNASSLLYDGLYPDSICGKNITAQQAQDEAFYKTLTGGGLFYNLNNLKDQKSFESKKYQTEDLFRIGEKGIEFIDCESNQIDQQKTDLFQKEMKGKGFQAPAVNAWSSNDMTNSEKYGFFLQDRDGNLFNLTMNQGAPECRVIEIPSNQISGISFLDRENVLAIVRTNDALFWLNPDLSYQQLPFPINVNQSVEINGNALYYSFHLRDAQQDSYYVLDKNLNLVNKRVIDIPIGKHQFSLADLIVPFTIQHATKGFQINMRNRTAILIMNLILVLILLAVGRYRKPVATDTLIWTAIFGIYGFIASYLIPSK